MSSVFEAQFEKQREVRGMKRRFKFALKAIYFLNLAGFLVGMIIVSSRQMKGDYYAKSVTLQFQDRVWDESYPLMRKQGRIFEPKIPLVYAVSRSVLIWLYSLSVLTICCSLKYFNGVYDKIDEQNEGRP